MRFAVVVLALSFAPCLAAEAGESSKPDRRPVPYLGIGWPGGSGTAQVLIAFDGDGEGRPGLWLSAIPAPPPHTPAVDPAPPSFSLGVMWRF